MHLHIGWQLLLHPIKNPLGNPIFITSLFPFDFSINIIKENHLNFFHNMKKLFNIFPPMFLISFYMTIIDNLPNLCVATFKFSFCDLVVICLIGFIPSMITNTKGTPMNRNCPLCMKIFHCLNASFG